MRLEIDYNKIGRDDFGPPPWMPFLFKKPDTVEYRWKGIRVYDSEMDEDKFETIILDNMLFDYDKKQVVVQARALLHQPIEFFEIKLTKDTREQEKELNALCD